ncbi:DUF6069 family protein [Agromyces endophyticus]|uniref:DUF6069 family protein n=1 Tax=Agromyces sp. H17E-10 TaxID=2932244 RepID=UPI001FD625C1|nr:DUF6069 family protein [Agromyces sp. H17E-10]UOQ90176.1 DUF6069 family protein [Agromyces sp. H17E-10]
MDTTTDQTETDAQTNDPTNAAAVRPPADIAAARRRRLLRAATVAAAVVLPLLVWVVAVPLAGLDLVAGVGPTAQTVTPASIVAVALLMGFAAWGVIALLERVTRHGRRIFAIVGWTLLALSLLGPVGAGASGAVLVTLLAMHLVTGGAIIIGLPLAARRRSAE